MDNQKFVELAKKAVADYFNSHKEITDEGRLTTVIKMKCIWMLTKNGTTSVLK